MTAGGPLAIGFTAPLGLLALLAIPAVLALHMFRRRFRERSVAGLFLFAADALPASAGRTRARLLRTPSLWLELLAALAAALWLGGFHLGTSSGALHLVVVLDDSASMAAKTPNGSVAEAARDRVRALLEDLGRDDAVTLVATGVRPAVLAGPRATRDVAREALAAWSPGQQAHDPARAFDLALDLGRSNATLVFLTDREDVQPPPRFRHVALGLPLSNAAIASVRRVAQGDAEERVFVDLLAYAEAPVTTAVRLEVVAGDGAREIARKDVTLTPGRSLHIAWTVPLVALPLRVTLDDDALAADNVAWLVPDPLRVVPAHVALEEEAADALQLVRVFDALPGVRVVEEPSDAALVVGRGDVSPRPGGIELVVEAPGAERDAWIGPFLLERRRVPGGGDGAPLLAGLTLEGVVWSAGQADPPGLPLVLAGERVLLAEETVAGRVRLHLNLDPARSNLPSSPDWPILLANLVEHVRRHLPGAPAVNVRLGEELALRVATPPQESDEYVLHDPDGEMRPARGWNLITWDAVTPGVHRVVRAGQDVARYAVSFIDPLESDLTRGAALDTPALDTAPVATASLEDPGRLEGRVLALLLLAFVALDWFVLGRRR
ncbi:MAG: VWA domain-containing protein [Planctomycetota bacterium]